MWNIVICITKWHVTTNFLHRIFKKQVLEVSDHCGGLSLLFWSFATLKCDLSDSSDCFLQTIQPVDIPGVSTTI